MKVELLVTLTGTRNGQEWPAKGSVVDLPDAEALDMLNAGLARPVAAEPETAAVAPTETPEPKARKR